MAGMSSTRTTILSGVVTLLFFGTISQAAHFSLTPWGEPSPVIIMDADFTITIKAISLGSKIGEYTDGSTHSRQVHPYGVHGVRSFMDLRLPKVTWSLIFNNFDSSKVTMNSQIQFVPNLLFPKSVTTYRGSIIYDDPAFINLGSPMNSYQCEHSVTTLYKPRFIIPGDTSFEVSMTVKNFRIQAYNVHEGQYSPAVHCHSGGSGISPPLGFVTIEHNQPGRQSKSPKGKRDFTALLAILKAGRENTEEKEVSESEAGKSVSATSGREGIIMENVLRFTEYAEGSNPGMTRRQNKPIASNLF